MSFSTIKSFAVGALVLGGALTAGAASELPAHAASNPACTPTTSSSGGAVVAAFAVGSCDWTVPAGVTSVDVLVVGGGGGGGGADNTSPDGGGGGGGGGQVISEQSVSVTAGEVIPVTVGSGGEEAQSPNLNGDNGDPSSFVASSASLQADGGGGGTGSGGDSTFPSGYNVAGTGGGSGSNAGGQPGSDGAGGGAGAQVAGSDGVDIPGYGANGGDGGAGVSDSITGTAVEYGCGGGGGGTVGSSAGLPAPTTGKLVQNYSSTEPVSDGILWSTVYGAGGTGGCSSAGNATAIDGTLTPAQAGQDGTGGGGGGGSVTACESTDLVVRCTGDTLAAWEGAPGGDGTVVVSYVESEVTTTTAGSTPTTSGSTPTSTTGAIVGTKLAYTGAELGGVIFLGSMLLFAGGLTLVLERKRSRRQGA